jgi:hypothetical protein
MQQRFAKREPSLALVGEPTQGILEPPKRTFANNRILQRIFQGCIDYRRDEAFHHPVLFPRRDRLDPYQQGRVHADQFGVSFEPKHTGSAVEEGTLVGDVTFEGEFERGPINDKPRHRPSPFPCTAIAADAAFQARHSSPIILSLGEKRARGRERQTPVLVCPCFLFLRPSLPFFLAHPKTTRLPVTIDGKTDWRRGLLEAARHPAPTTVGAAIAQTLDAGVDAALVRAFVSEHSAVFGDVAAVFGPLGDARRAADRFFHQGTPPLPAPTSTAASRPTLKPHALRLQQQSSSVPWFQRASLPAPSMPLEPGPGFAVVQGERFDAADVAALLRGL